MNSDYSTYKKIAISIANALGIGAASFASGDFGLRTTDFGPQTMGFFERGENKSEQRYSGKPDGDSRNAQKGLKTKDYGLKVWDR